MTKLTKHNNHIEIEYSISNTTVTAVEVMQDIDTSSFFESDRLSAYRKLLLVYDHNLPPETIQHVQRKFNKHILTVHTLSLNTDSKDLKCLKFLWDKMLEYKPDCIVALGGGTTSDLTGFAASTYRRGIDVIFMPTTLLAAVDACIGGKTGIDYSEIKNSVGSIKYPLIAIIVLDFLKSLDEQLFLSAWAEIIKIAILYNQQFFKTIEQYIVNFAGKPSENFMILLADAIEQKAKVVERAENKFGLLYGHNIGHALESLDKHRLTHGEYVAIGMNIEAAMGIILDVTDPDVWHRQHELLRQLNLLSELDESISVERLKAQMKRYKLYENGNYYFVLPEAVGKVPVNRNTIINEADFDIVYQQALNWITSQ